MSAVINPAGVPLVDPAEPEAATVAGAGEAAPHLPVGRPGSRCCSGVLWTIPTFGLFVTSFRPADEIKTSGWWTFFSNPGVTLENYRDGAVRRRLPASPTT